MSYMHLMSDTFALLRNSTAHVSFRPTLTRVACVEGELQGVQATRFLVATDGYKMTLYPCGEAEPGRTYSLVKGDSWSHLSQGLVAIEDQMRFPDVFSFIRNVNFHRENWADPITLAKSSNLTGSAQFQVVLDMRSGAISHYRNRDDAHSKKAADNEVYIDVGLIASLSIPKTLLFPVKSEDRKANQPQPFVIQGQRDFGSQLHYSVLMPLHSPTSNSIYG